MLLFDLEVTDNDKHSSLLPYAINYGCKKFYDTGSTDSAQVGCDFVCNYQTRMEVTGSDKHSSLLQCRINYNFKKYMLR